MSPEADMKANEGCHASTGFLSVGGAGCSSIHFLPLTAPGRNNNPSSAINARNASRVFFSSAIFENACSVVTISCNADCPCALTAKQITIRSTTNLIAKSVLNPSNPWLLLLFVTPIPVSIHQLIALQINIRDSSPPVDHTSQTTPASKNSPSTPLCFAPHTPRSFRKPAPCCRCRCRALAHRAGARLHPGAANEPR